jgi:hypothetical protein
VTWFEQSSLDLFVGQIVGADVNVSFKLDLSLNLSLPLVLFEKTGSANRIEETLGAVSFTQQLAV